uniref:Uncharacterized protein n=1 Tax=Chromera velia CCMP2878 TaxID=1169474 RepID=A0A0G4GPB4_9ALVE|eukprot:Cvel_22786.t1-p1 / transcript=Cvel_22786.t1 / gene=Cvel_22786 / organism=Chromera_velia_CCMP2878 / gene_product=Kinase D-interacting substrate of 220 kDa, putative / transcript_product=Kinase D-interacting substrate of 220 kDa, putative / location=Cvel_scaffold2279:9991-11145(+) / protein_length=385 / sequence_SO=supercontig / SO=protein_coding / is_pseudo=false
MILQNVRRFRPIEAELLREQVEKCADEREGRADLVLLLRLGADINELVEVADRFLPGHKIYRETALHLAASIGSVDTVLTLLEYGAAVERRDSAGWSALIRASWKGRTPVVKVLLEAKAAIDVVTEDKHWTALMQASHKGHLDVVRVLTEAGADPNKSARDGEYTALLLASMAGHSKVVEILISAGANMEACDGHYGSTPLIWASDIGNVEVVRILIEGKADPNAQCGIGQTALIKASENGHTEVVRAILTASEDVDVDACDPDGTRALMLAAGIGYTDIVKLLVEAKANLHAVDAYRKTALARACDRGHDAVAEILRGAAASAAASSVLPAPPEDLNLVTNTRRWRDRSTDPGREGIYRYSTAGRVSSGDAPESFGDLDPSFGV